MEANSIATPQTKKPTTPQPEGHSASALNIGEELKEFVVTGIIGEGGFGIVYSARDTLLHRNVAIKEYMPAAIASRRTSKKITLRSERHQQTFSAGMQGFIDEARLLAQFKHPALVEILRFWEANGTAYMAMPQYSGKTLRTILKNPSNRCSERWLKSILGPMLDAIELLHNNHVYHRDIAPDNIVIQDAGQPVLLDLGSARRVIAGMQSALTVVVKPGYAPIEQYTEDTANEQGPWTDIYALGAVLYFAINGSAPIASVSRMMRDSLKPLNTNDHPLYSDSFLFSINKALQLRPRDRFQSIADFRDALNIHTSLTSNISLATLTSEDTKANQKPISDQHKDDEITLILSEGEISVFKEKLLHSLNLSREKELPSQELNENILNKKLTIKDNSSISSFDDVKDILEDKTHVTKNGNSQNHKEENNQQEKSNKTKDNHLSVKHTAVKYPVAIGIFALTCIAFTIVFIVESIHNEDIKPMEYEQTPIPKKITNSYKTTDSSQNKFIQEKIYVISKTPDHSVISTDNKITFGENVLERTMFSEHNLAELSNANSNQQLEMPTKLESTKANKLTGEPKKSFITEDTQAHNNDTNKSVKDIIVDDERAAEAGPKKIEMGSAKLKLVPWGEIWANGERFGVSPPLREILLAPGTYTVELRNPGLPTETRTLRFEKGENPVIHHNFYTKHSAEDKTKKNSNMKESQKLSATEQAKHNTNTSDIKEPEKPISESEPNKKLAITGERILNFKILPWGEIFLNGKMVGVTPPLHNLKLDPGDHKIEIRHPNYATKIINISADDPAIEIIEHQF